MVGHLPIELWQHIACVLSEQGERGALYSLARTCAQLWSTCSPGLGDAVFLQHEQHTVAYLAALTSARIGPPRELHLRYGWAEGGNVDDKIEERLTRLCKLTSGSDDRRPKHQLSRLQIAGPGVERDTLKSWDMHKLDELCLMQQTADPDVLRCLPQSLCQSLRRLCVTSCFDSQVFELLAKADVLEHLVLLQPSVSTTMIAGDPAFEWLLASRRSLPRITLLNPLANTINHPRFRSVARCNADIDQLARHPLLRDVPIYRLNTEQMSTHEYDDFDKFVEREFEAGTLWSYCTANGFRCGQSTGLGLVPY